MSNLFSRHRILNASMISAIFLLVILVLLWSINRYWSGVLQPRLQLAAETHAQVLSDAQSAPLVNIIEHTAPPKLERALTTKVQEMLLITDPAINQPLFRAVEISLDYDLVDAPTGSLDLSLGVINCPTCYRFDVPLIGEGGALLGIASIQVTDAYYRRLGGDMKSKLFAELSVALVLIALVWVAALMLFFRLQRAREMIELSDRAKTRFMANVSHELRTPLNAILGYTQLYRRNRELMRQYGQGINTIDRSADHLLTMINDILDFSRAGSDRIQLVEREVVLRDFLGLLVEMTQIRARTKDVGFSYQFSDALPAVVMVDDKRLRQVLLNLLNNAVKFTRQGGVEFNVRTFGRRREDQSAAPTVVFEIIDTGPGIPADNIEEIFLPFHQLEVDEAAAEGSGLGLAISKSLLELMQSQLKVESTPGVGSRFWFELKLPVVLSAEHTVGELDTEVLDYVGRRRDVLTVDDNAFNRDVIRQRLESYGFTVTEAESGERALTLLSEKSFDLVLLDLLMPGLDGFDTLARIRDLPSAQGMPVVALTAAVQEQTERRAREAGFDAVLIKPVSDRDLLAQLQTTLNLEWVRAAPEPQAPSTDGQALPPAAVLEQLKALAQEHNVLGLREQLMALEQQGEWSGFVAAIQPLVRGYQFKQLVRYLDGLAVE